MFVAVDGFDRVLSNLETSIRLGFLHHDIIGFETKLDATACQERETSAARGRKETNLRSSNRAQKAIVSNLRQYESIMGRLIINGDDFAISSETNHAIVRAHRDGILTSASLMVTGSAFEEAVALAKELPNLSVGIHLVLIQGRPVLPPCDIPNLVGKDGNFRNNPVSAGMAFFFFPSLATQIKKETEAQIEKFLSTGIPLSHINGHLNIHVHPTVLAIVIDLGARYGIKGIRLPREDLTINLRLDRSHCIRKLTQWAIFALLSRHAGRRLKGWDFRIPDRTYGLLQSGRMDEQYLIGLLEEIGHRSCEISFHLGTAPDWPTYYDGQQELSAVLSETARDRIQLHGHKLITYVEL